MESEAGVYHVINRGHYRADIFRTEKTRVAFLQCLKEACAKTGWQVHAWCVMSNHYHLAVSTPKANLVEGMRWLQGTFATRFNRLRREQGHLFQGRYKSLVVDPDGGLGPLCHYIYLNPVRAGLRSLDDLANDPWTSLRWLLAPKDRPEWYQPQPALNHAGTLADTAVGRRKYLQYLSWLSADEPARKEQQFATMSKGWTIGTKDFAKTVLQEQRAMIGHGRRMAAAMQETNEALWQDELTALLAQLKRGPAEVKQELKSAAWKAAVAAAMKRRTTATNRWLATALNMGGLHEVSRQVGRWKEEPDRALERKLRRPTNYEPI